MDAIAWGLAFEKDHEYGYAKVDDSDLGEEAADLLCQIELRDSAYIPFALAWLRDALDTHIVCDWEEQYPRLTATANEFPQDYRTFLGAMKRYGFDNLPVAPKMKSDASIEKARADLIRTGIIRAA